MTLEKIQINTALEKSIQKKMPWLFSHEFQHHLPSGTPALLQNAKGKTLAFGLCDEGDLTFRILGRNPHNINHLLQERFQQACLFRHSILPNETNCYRLINGEGDGLSGIIVDIYDDTAVLRIYSKAWLPFLECMVQSLSQFDFIKRVYRKFGVRKIDGQKGGITLWGTELPSHLTVKEHGVHFLVRPKEGQKTGFFLDQREHRRIIGSISKDKVVANLFAYNGGFSIYAALGGAKRVYSVDIAADALEDAKEIFRLNGLNPQKHVFDAGDAFRWNPPEAINLMVCDPPSLSKGKQSDSNAWNAYSDLAKHCASHIAKNDILATASCTARLSSKEWERAIQEGIQKQGEWSWCWRSYEPMDHIIDLNHPQSRYLKFAMLYRRK